MVAALLFSSSVTDNYRAELKNQGEALLAQPSEPVQKRPKEDVVACEIEGGAALLDMATNNYLKLNSTASLIWNWLEEGLDYNSITEKMCEIYDVSPERCRQDVLTMFDQFEEAGLLVSNDG